MKTFYIGMHLCSRCKGHDPNCNVCHTFTEEEQRENAAREKADHERLVKLRKQYPEQFNYKP